MGLFLNEKKYVEDNGTLVKEEVLNGFIKRQDIIMSELLVELENSINGCNLTKFKVLDANEYEVLTNISLIKHSYIYNNKNYDFITIKNDILHDKVFI